MSENNDDGTWLLGLGLLSIIWLLNGNGNSTAKDSLNSSDIEEIVNQRFVFDDNTEFLQLLVYYSTPGFMKKVKKEMVENVLLPKLYDINRSVRQKGESYHETLPIHGEKETKDFFNCLVENCIFSTEKIIGFLKLPMKMLDFNKYLKSQNKIWGGVTDFASNSIMYKAIKQTTKEYFKMVYLHGISLNEALRKAADYYKTVYEQTVYSILE